MSILTTHVGSLPRTQKVVDFIFARERQDPYDEADFDAAMTEAVMDTVAKQRAAGCRYCFR
jgi:5-methyltetrahydropteroyltriglutamate--homocysteine methyltransferase